MEELIRQILDDFGGLYTDVLVAKNLVNGKPIDADRKLQSIQTKIIKLSEFYKVKFDELVPKNEIESAGT